MSDVEAPGELLVKVDPVSKTFNGNVVLDKARIELLRGEVHALLGHNGSGKSTLIKILAGVYEPDPGSRAWFRGQEVSLEESAAEWRKSIRFIHQDVGLIPSLSAAENLALVRGYKRTRIGSIDWKRERAAAEAAMARLGGHFDVTLPARELTRSAQSLVAIARAFEDLDEEAAPVIILDEPTASLPQREVEVLFDAIRRVKADGAAVMLVSHRLNDVTELADRITVLRDGRVVAAGLPGRRSKGELVSLITGSATPTASSTDAAVRPGSGDEIARFAGLEGETVRDLGLCLQRGEVLGVAGLDGSGREEVAELLNRAAMNPADQVAMGPAAKPVITSDTSGLFAEHQARVALVPADRRRFGLIDTMSVRENLTLPWMAPVSSWGRIRRRKEAQSTDEWIERMDVRPRNREAKVSSLSGGNAQKVLLAKALRNSPQILIADEPSVGVDVGAKAQIYAHLRDICREGIGVVVTSSDTEELATLCDRVLVLARGRLVGELTGEGLTEDAIHRLCHEAAMMDDGTNRGTAV